jgi:hypothetical protein
MDASERLADQYLRSLGIGIVEYEPDGNIPPDFCIDGRIAVEVRRLNQNYELSDGTRQGLEELATRLMDGFRTCLQDLGESLGGECWYVCPVFRRPLEGWRVLRPFVESRLRSFKDLPIRTQTRIRITPNLNLDLIRSGRDHGPFFLLGPSSDEDSGGWVMGEVERNLRLCIAEKERKIDPYRSKYSEWWLVLADHIDYSMDPEDRLIFKSEVMSRIPHRFRKIVLVDPLDHRRAFET